MKYSFVFEKTTFICSFIKAEKSDKKQVYIDNFSNVDFIICTVINATQTLVTTIYSEACGLFLFIVLVLIMSFTLCFRCQNQLIFLNYFIASYYMHHNEENEFQRN